MAKRTFAIVAVFAALLSVTLSVQAEDYDYFWTGNTNSNYQNKGNWALSDGSPAPVALDGNTGDRITANIQSSNGTITLDYGNLCDQVFTLNLGQTGGSATASLSRSGGFTIDSGKTINVLDKGTFNYSNGALTNSGTITISGGSFSHANSGYNFVNDGTINVTGGSFTYDNQFSTTATNIRQIQSNGTINISGGTFTVETANSMRIGNSANSTMNISGSGELIVNSPAYIGIGTNTGTINQTGGTATFNSDLDLGWGNGAVGHYNLTGGTLTTTAAAGLWTGNPNGISTFTVDGGTANFNYTHDGSTVDSFTVGLTGNNQLANVFTLSSGTINVADTFRVRNSGILNVSGGTFDTKGLAIDSGTFTQTGGDITAETFTLASSGTYRANPGAALNVTEGSGTAALNGTIDVTGFANYVGEYGETQTIISASSISGTPTFTNTSKWTASVDGNNVIVSYNGTDDYYWTGYKGTDGQGRYCFYTLQNWKQNGSQITEGDYLNTNANCYILDTSKDGNVINVWIDYSTLGVKSLTVGSGDGTKTAKAYRPDSLLLSDTITINKGGFVEIKSIDIRNGGKLNITGGTLNLSSGGLSNSAGAYTITLTGGTFGNYSAQSNPNWSTSLNATISANEVTFAPSEGNTITWSGVLSGAGGVVVDGKGSLTLSGANTYSGGTTISDGKLIVTETGALGSGAVVNNADLEFNLGGAKTISNNISGTGTITKTGSGDLSLSSTSNNSIDCDLVIDQGKVILTNKIDNQNRFTKTVTINSGGTLQCDAQDSIGYSDAPATFNLYGGTLILNGHNETLKNKTVNLKGGTISSTSATSYFDVFQDGNSFHVEGTEQATAANPTVSHISGWIRLRNTTDFNITVDENAKLVVDKNYGIVDNTQSTKPLVKLGPGVLVYEGANTYTQGTTISEGTLILTENGTLGTGNVTNNATLEFAHAGDKAFSNVISGTGVVNKTGAGTLELTGANTYSGTTTISAGTLKLSGAGALGTGNVVNNATLEFAQTGAQSFSNVISGTGAVIKSGAGTVTLSGANTYTGATTISAGTLEISNNFTSSSGLAGSGTLKLSGDQKYFNIGDASEFTGTVQVFDTSISAQSRVNLAGANGTTSTNIDLSNATVVINGASSKTSEMAFSKGNSTLKIGTLNGNAYSRILNTDGTTTTATYNNLIVGNGNYAGEIGRSTNYTSYPFVNHINLTKADDDSETGGTLTLSAKYLTYIGTTTIEGGTLEITNNLSGDAYQYFARSTALKGSGTLSFTGDNWTVFSIDTTDTTTPQEFSGTVNVSGKIMLTREGLDSARDLNLGNATINVKSTGLIGLFGHKDTAVSNLTAKELNVESGGVIRICKHDPGSAFGTLTVGRGLISGTLGQENTVWNQVNLVKVSDGSETGGRLTISGNNYYNGTTTVSAGVLELTGDAVVANGPVTVANDGTLEYNVANGKTKKLSIDATNKILSTGQVIKTGDGTLQLYALYAEADKMIDVNSLTVSSGRVDIKEYFYGKLIVDSEGTFSPGNSVGSLTIGESAYGTDGFILNDNGAELLMEIAGSAPTANDVLIVNGGDIELGDGSVITLALTGNSLGRGESFTAILSADNSSTLDVLSHIQTTDFTDLKYETVTYLGNTVYAITGRTFNANEVPEPSTWALLILGAAGLLYWRKRKSNK